MVIKIAKTRNDKTYERGFKDGKEGDLLDDVIMGLGLPEMIPPRNDKDDSIYRSGYNEGAEHRHDDSNNSGNGSSSSNESESDEGGCYLTTACVTAMGLSDDCFELDVLRDFRENVLMKTQKGRNAITDYERMAPTIIEAVYEKEGSRALGVFRGLYPDIRIAVQLILSQRYDEAFDHYRKMSLKLAETYA